MDDILKEDWSKYLDRDQPIFFFTSIDSPYGTQLKEATGFGFTSQLYYFKGSLGTFYKLKKELKEADAYYASLISRKDKRIKTWIKDEQKSRKLAKALKIDMPIRKAVEMFEFINLYNTVIPYRLLSAYSNAKPDKELLDKLEKIRLISLYPVLMHDFFPKLLKRLSTKTKIPVELLLLCTAEELISIDEGKTKMNINDLKKRSQGCYFMKKGKRWVFKYTDKDSLSIAPEKIALKGTVAYKGIVTGIAKIVNKPSDMIKFSKGDILVSINTNPSLMPAISKSSAILSDEGGITCHAAIVAREMKKPCITGLKHATRTIKDGDRIEVDADKGTVRIL